jgi:hypothetical protein
VNSDKDSSHAVVLYRGATSAGGDVPNYIFGGAFWPIYLRPDAQSHMLDGTQPIPTLSSNEGPPMGLLDFGSGATPRYLVAFIFNLAPGQTWSTGEGGFKGLTPTSGVCYALDEQIAGNYCAGYDEGRVTAWDKQSASGTPPKPATTKGYSPNPTTFFTYAFRPAPATKEVTLGFTDSIEKGVCIPRAGWTLRPHICLSLPDAGGYLLSGSTTSGFSDYSPFVTIEGLLTQATPSVVATGLGSFLMAFVGHSDQTVYVGSSDANNGTTWSSEKLNLLSGYSPALVNAGGLFLLYVVEPDANRNITVSHSSDGHGWIGPQAIGQQTLASPCVIQTPFAGSPPGYPNYAYMMAFVSNDSGYNLLVCTSQDGVSWTRGPNVGQQSGRSPSLAVVPANWPFSPAPTANPGIWIAFVSNDGTNEILLSSTDDGYNWGGLIKTGHHTRGAPVLRFMNAEMLLIFLGNDPSDPSIFACHTTDPADWNQNPEVRICAGIAGPAFA